MNAKQGTGSKGEAEAVSRGEQGGGDGRHCKDIQKAEAAELGVVGKSSRGRSVRKHAQCSSLDHWVEGGVFKVPGGEEEKKVGNEKVKSLV